MKALIVYPEIPETYWSFKHILKFLRKRAAHPPLGAATIAAMMPSDWDVRLIDMNVESLTDEVIQWADMVFVSAMIVQKGCVREVIERARSFGKPIVGGGPLFTSCPEEFDDIDHLVLNEGEVTFPMFLRDLANGGASHRYESWERPDIRLTPVPRWDLIQFKYYASMAVQYSRGCPFNCEFCDIVNLNGRRPRVKSDAQMMAEFDIIYRKGWRGRVFVVDDNFIGNKAKAKSMLRKLAPWQQERNYPFSIYTEASVNLADDEELMDLMVVAGFDCVFLGLETPEEASLQECGKHQNSGKNLLESVQKIQSKGMEVMGGFIIGFDNDPPSIFETQINFIQNSGVVKAMIGLLNALPGTRLYERLKSEGRLLEDTTGNNTDGSMNFVPRMDAQTLKDGYNRVLEGIYSPKEYYNRVCQFLKNYKPVRRKRIDMTEIMAFLRSIVYLGILDSGKSRIYYWKLIIKAFLFHRRAFGDAVSSAIYGYHFRKLLNNRKSSY